MKEKKMKDINKNETQAIIGGASLSLTGAILNAITSLAKYVYTLGQSLGSSMRRLVTGKTCSCK